MSVTTIEEFIIPYFSLLNAEEKLSFESSNAGKEFRTLVTSMLMAEQTYQQSYSIWNLIFGNKETEEQNIKSIFLEAKKNYLTQFGNTQAYQTAISTIAIARLTHEIPDFKFLNPTQKQELINMQSSLKLLEQLDLLDSQINKEYKILSNLDEWGQIKSGSITRGVINDLIKSRNTLLEDWESEFSSSPDFSMFKQTIDEQLNKQNLHQYEVEVTNLARILPILNYQAKPNTQTITQQLIARFIARTKEKTKTTINLVDELSGFFFFYMNQINRLEISFINLSSFNGVQSRRLAEATIDALKSQTPLDFNNWFKQYEDDLSQYLEYEFQLINGTHIAEPKQDFKQEMMNSLSFLWTNPVVQKTNSFVGRLAEAHAFIQATNFSTQNESSFLAILDIYNYGKYYDRIAETKTIIQSLLMPINPLAGEYRDIGLYEQNMAKKFLRILIPILIIVAAIVLLSLLLTPLALPELIFIAAIIPEIIIGLGVASLYISFKNDIYQFVRELYYGGQYEIPEFQINQRMVASFGNEANALGVRAFYLDALRYCDFVEAGFQDKQNKNTLTSDDIKQRKDNIYKRHRLCLEWYDIHSNKELGVDEVSKIVIKTLQQEVNEEYKLLQKTLKKEREIIREAVHAATSDLKDIFVNNNITPETTQDSGNTQPPVIRTQYRLGLFKPPICLQHKIHAEEMGNLGQELDALNLKPSPQANPSPG